MLEGMVIARGAANAGSVNGFRYWIEGSGWISTKTGEYCVEKGTIAGINGQLIETPTRVRGNYNEKS